MTRVLIADDDVDTRETLTLLLTEEGYQTFETSDGLQALSIVLNDPQPLIALLDFSMPRLDGLSLLQRVTSHPPLHPRAYIFMTGYAPTKYADQTDLLTQLQVQILAKPFDIDAVLTLVHQAEISLASNR